MHVNQIAKSIHSNAKEKGFWGDYRLAKMQGPEDEAAWICTKLLLVHSELSEAMEALRCGDHANFAEELADAVIRLLDLAEGLGIDMEMEIITKHIANKARPHKHNKLF